jgi:hypothetical protein
MWTWTKSEPFSSLVVGILKTESYNSWYLPNTQRAKYRFPHTNETNSKLKKTPRTGTRQDNKNSKLNLLTSLTSLSQLAGPLNRDLLTAKRPRERLVTERITRQPRSNKDSILLTREVQSELLRISVGEAVGFVAGAAGAVIICAGGRDAGCCDVAEV